MFNPVDINDDNNDITEYQSDLNPEICYFKHSHTLLRICNYHMENSFDKYLSNHNNSSNPFSVKHFKHSKSACKFITISIKLEYSGSYGVNFSSHWNVVKPIKCIKF